MNLVSSIMSVWTTFLVSAINSSAEVSFGGELLDVQPHTYAQFGRIPASPLIYGRDRYLSVVDDTLHWWMIPVRDRCPDCCV